MKLYHLTKSSNVASISVNGLVPFKSKKGLSTGYVTKDQPWRKKVVWLTDDPDYILTWQGGSDWARDCVMYEVDCSGLKVEHREGFYDNHEWLHYGTIPTSHITLLGEKKYPENNTP